MSLSVEVHVTSGVNSFPYLSVALTSSWYESPSLRCFESGEILIVLAIPCSISMVCVCDTSAPFTVACAVTSTSPSFCPMLLFFFFAK